MNFTIMVLVSMVLWFPGVGHGETCSEAKSRAVEIRKRGRLNADSGYGAFQRKRDSAETDLTSAKAAYKKKKEKCETDADAGRAGDCVDDKKSCYRKWDHIKGACRTRYKEYVGTADDSYDAVMGRGTERKARDSQQRTIDAADASAQGIIATACTEAERAAKEIPNCLCGVIIRTQCNIDCAEGKTPECHCQRCDGWIPMCQECAPRCS